MNFRDLSTTVVLVLTLAATTRMEAQDRRRLGPVDGPTVPATDLNRVKVGDVAPDFTLAALDGRAISLSAYRNKQNVVLVFYRGWW